jgi:uncharacterized protein with PIN domain
MMKRLHDRYLVFKRTTDIPNGPLESVDNFFVLKWDTDPIARKVLSIYAKNMELMGEVDFAKDIETLLEPYKLKDAARRCPLCGSSDFARRVKEVYDSSREKYVEEEDYCICGECGNLFR